mmetsp:Transcript_28468/g.94507  ORF Transcript_28468/g.94507 Transcript_28468/m.94507 type:complete len:352 (+) Transcript_28468:126-1181(+)
MPRQRRNGHSAALAAAPPLAADASRAAMSLTTIVAQVLIVADLNDQERRCLGENDAPVTFAELCLHLNGDADYFSEDGLRRNVETCVDIWKGLDVFDESLVMVTVTLGLSGAVLSDRKFFVGACVSDVCEHLQRIRPTSAGTGCRLKVSERILEHCEELLEVDAESITAVVCETTSAMVRNMPYSWTPNQMFRWLDDQGLAGTYDLVYVPIDLVNMDIRQGSNPGYVFVNFRRRSDAECSFRILDGFDLGSTTGRRQVRDARWQGQSAYTARCRQKLGSGEAHQLLSMQLGVVPCAENGARLSLENWLGVPQLPSLHELAASAADGQTAVFSRYGLASQEWREAVFARFAE